MADDCKVSIEITQPRSQNHPIGFALFKGNEPLGVNAASRILGGRAWHQNTYDGDLPGGNSYTIVTQTFQAEQMGPFIVRVVSENAVEKGATISGGKWVATTFSF